MTQYRKYNKLNDTAMKFLKLLPLLLLGLIFPSCNNEDNPKENTSQLTIKSSSNYISSVNLEDNSFSILPGADYGVLVNFDRQTLQLFINNLQFDPAERAISFTLPEIRLDITTNGWRILHNEAIQVQAGASTYSVSQIEVNFALRADGSQNIVAINYTLDGKYKLTTLFTYNQFIGTTTSTDMTDPADAPYSTNQSRYLVIIDDKTKTAELQIAYPKFVEAMPAERVGILVFKNIPLTFTKDGFTFETTNIVPQIKDTPYPDYTITNMYGNVAAGKSMKLSFECAKYNRKVTVDGTAY